MRRGFCEAPEQAFNLGHPLAQRCDIPTHRSLSRNKDGGKCNRSDNDADHFPGSCCQYNFPGELLGERKAREESLQTRGAAPPGMTAGGSSWPPKQTGRSKSVPRALNCGFRTWDPACVAC